MQKDVEAGRPFELETILGVLVRKARQGGVATPCIDMAYAALKPVLLKATG
jgi:ketopantoate reductase